MLMHFFDLGITIVLQTVFAFAAYESFSLLMCLVIESLITKETAASFLDRWLDLVGVSLSTLSLMDLLLASFSCLLEFVSKLVSKDTWLGSSGDSIDVWSVGLKNCWKLQQHSFLGVKVAWYRICVWRWFFSMVRWPFHSVAYPKHFSFLWSLECTRQNSINASTKTSQ